MVHEQKCEFFFIGDDSNVETVPFDLPAVELRESLEFDLSVYETVETKRHGRQHVRARFKAFISFGLR